MLIGLGNAGKPGEHLNFAETRDIQEHYGSSNPTDVLSEIYGVGSTENGVFGIKQGYSQPRFANTVAAIDPGIATDKTRPIAIWETLFPNHKHVFLARRNKFRLAVSWWKAIQTGQSFRVRGEKPADMDLSGAYDGNALRQLMFEAVAREAGISEMLAAARIVPLNVCYEDLLLDPQREVGRIMTHLGLPMEAALRTTFERQADDVSEDWVQRLRREVQEGWTNAGW